MSRLDMGLSLVDAANGVILEAEDTAKEYVDIIGEVDFSWLKEKVAGGNENLMQAICYWEDKAYDDVEALLNGESFEPANHLVMKPLQNLYLCEVLHNVSRHNLSIARGASSVEDKVLGIDDFLDGFKY